jgi:hypothetical protein
MARRANLASDRRFFMYLILRNAGLVTKKVRTYWPGMIWERSRMIFCSSAV